jgi:hypothetical protein
MFTRNTGYRRLQIARWSAYVNAVLSIIGGVTLFLIYGLEAPRLIATGTASQQAFGPLSNYAGLLQFRFMLPLTAALHQLALADDQRLSLAVAVLGSGGLFAASIARALPVTLTIDFAVHVPIILVTLVLIGFWLIVANRQGRIAGNLTLRLAHLGEFTRIMFALLCGVAFLLVLVNWREPSMKA